MTILDELFRGRKGYLEFVPMVTNRRTGTVHGKWKEVCEDDSD